MRGIECSFVVILAFHTQTDAHTFCGRQPHPGKGKPSVPNGHGAERQREREQRNISTQCILFMHLFRNVVCKEWYAECMKVFHRVLCTYRLARVHLVRPYRRGLLFDHVYLEGKTCINDQTNGFVQIGVWELNFKMVFTNRTGISFGSLFSAWTFLTWMVKQLFSIAFEFNENKVLQKIVMSSEIKKVRLIKSLQIILFDKLLLAWNSVSSCKRKYGKLCWAFFLKGLNKKCILNME